MGPSCMSSASRSPVSSLIVAILWIMLALVPMPVGSNRPFFWDVNAAWIGLLAFFHLGYLASDPSRLRVSLSALRWPGLLMLAAMLFMVIQVMPLPFELSPQIWTEAGAALGMSLTRRISLDPAATIAMLVSYLAYALLFFMTAQVSVNPRRVQRLLQGLFWIIVAHAALGVLFLFQLGDSLFFLPKWTYHGFATGFFVNRNSFATFLAFGLAIGSALLADAVVPKPRRQDQNRPAREIVRLDQIGIALGIYGAGLATIGSSLMLTGSRMGALVGAIGLFAPAIFAATRLKRRLTFAGLIVGLILIVTLIFIMSGGALTERFASQEASQDARWLLFKQTLEMIRHRPLTGFGGGAFEDAFAIYHHLPLNADVVWDRAHNLYLELFADLGIFALCPIISVGLVLWQTMRGLRHAENRVAPIIAITVVVIAAVHSLVDFSLQIQAIELYFVVLLAAGFAQSTGSAETTAPMPRSEPVANPTAWQPVPPAR